MKTLRRRIGRNMNYLKKLLGYIVTMAMVLTLTQVGIGAVHAEGTTYTLSLTNNGQTNHTFEVYQVFTGDLKDSTLSNIQWGNGITEAGKTALGSASAQAKSLKGNDDDSAVARTFAKNLVDKNYLQKGTKVGEGTEVTVERNETQDVTGLAAGYYLVKDKAESQKDQVNGANTLYILKVVKDTTATTKLDVPTVTKKVKDINDTDGTPSEWQDSADYDIGDSIDYKIDGKLPGNYDKYEKYKYEFTDTMSAGLTYKADAKLYVVNDDVETQIVNPETKAYYTETSENDNRTIKWKFENLKDVPNVKASSIIRVKYSATLNQNAVIGATGNPNTVNLTYSNNPNKTDGGETGKTPDDTNIVFTYEAIFNKVNENKQALAGAKFELFKKVKKTDNTGFDWVSKGILDPTEVGGKYTYTFKGLDDGVYKLVEKQTPAGYNTMEDKIFTIAATHTQDPSILKLTGLSVDGGLVSDNNNKDKNATVDVSTGTISADIVNKPGTELPETGGMGTTLLYVLGGVLVALAAAYVIYTKKHEKA